jgi:hypothetical protein
MSELCRESAENENEIPIPMSERVKISELKFDQDNPNRLTLMQLDCLKASNRYTFQLTILWESLQFLK